MLQRLGVRMHAVMLILGDARERKKEDGEDECAATNPECKEDDDHQYEHEVKLAEASHEPEAGS